MRAALEKGQELLPLDTAASDEIALRAAFALCFELAGRMSFEQAMADPTIALALRNTAEAMRKK